MPEPSAVREWRDVSATTFRDQILPANQPALMRGAVRLWPAVAAGRESPVAWLTTCAAIDIGASVETMHGDAVDWRPVLLQRPTLRFQLRAAFRCGSPHRSIGCSISPPCPHLHRCTSAHRPLPTCLPGFARDNVLDLFDPSLVARLWLSQPYHRADALRSLVQHHVRRGAGRRRSRFSRPSR